MASFCKIFIEVYDRGRSLKDLRDFVSGQSEGQVKNLRKVPAQPKFKDWAMTISEVYLVGEPKGAADRVRAWTKVVRKQM